jgi:hypothetical protein
LSLDSTTSTTLKTGLPPEYFVQLTTENALQLTITKSSLCLVKTLLTSYTTKGVEPDEGLEEVDLPAPETFEPVYCIKNMVGGLGEREGGRKGGREGDGGRWREGWMDGWRDGGGGMERDARREEGSGRDGTEGRRERGKGLSS